jgi:hypothetical protein
MSSKSYRTTSWYDARVEIRPSLIQGGGMFARQPIQAGEIVAIVGGTVMTEDVSNVNYLGPPMATISAGFSASICIASC